MKKAVALIILLLVALSAAAVALVTFETNGRTVRMAENAMDSGDYERARRLYNFALERGEAGPNDERVFYILTVYLEASDCLEKEEFAEGLEILYSCRYDYSSLAISDDMDELYAKLSDGKYADERIRALSGVINAQNYERAKEMADEIGRLSLTPAQQDRLYALTREITAAGAARPESIMYYVNRDPNDDIPMYSEPSADGDELLRIAGGEGVEVIAFAENGFIEVYYGGQTGYVRGSALSADKPSLDNKPSLDKTGSAADNKDNETEDRDGSEDGEGEDEDENVPVEAVSDGDKLFVLTGVNLRPEPTTDSEVIDVVPAGAEITYKGKTEHGFYLVEYNGKEGYVYSDYVSNK